MARRVHPISVTEVYEPGRDFRLKYDGFGQHDVVAQLIGQGRASVSAIDLTALGVPGWGHHGTAVPTAMVLGPGTLNSVICRPLLDTTQTIGLEAFGRYGGYWAELEGLGLPSEVKLYQYDGRPNRVTGAESRFLLPPDPMFCVSLYRAEPAADHDWFAHPPATEVRFGATADDEWALALPYGGSPFLSRRRDGAWVKVGEVEGSVRLPTSEGFAKGQRSFVWIAVVRGRIVVSTDGFVEELWTYCDPEGEIRVASAPVSLWHSAGQWAFSMFGVKMAEATLDSLGIEAGYDTQDCSGELLLRARQRPVVADGDEVLAEVVLLDTTGEREDLETTQRAWRAVISPHEHVSQYVTPDGVKSFSTMVSPELYSVQIGQYPEVETLASPASAEVQDEVLAVQGEHPAELRTARYDLLLDNQLGRQTELGKYRRARIALGWRYDDGSTDTDAVFDGYVAEPVAEVEEGGRSAVRATLLDPMIRLRDEKCDGRSPVFDGWPLVGAFQWILGRCGLPGSRQDLEDTGVELSRGTPESPLWHGEPGRSWVELLEAMAEFDHRAGLWFDQNHVFEKTCRHCRNKRTAEDVTLHDGISAGGCSQTVDWELYTRAELKPESSDDAAVIALTRPKRTLSTDEFANYVVASGVGSDGRPVRALVYDAASLYDPDSDAFVGWRKMDVRALSAYTTQADVNRLAATTFAEVSQRPERIVVVVPLESAIRIGQVLVIRGGEAVAAQGQKYRVTAVHHDARRLPRRLARTEVRARWIGEEE